ncbi:MAG: phage tail protein [Halomonas sp.]|nr:phage tail protein [Halomonas sp.]|tara:strand:- start:6662 stop:6877 length:216 start_codon:yes stop_codon:yes gene_type:complete
MANTYRTVQGDTWDIISKKQYASEKYVDILIAANWPQRQGMIFPAGIQLSIPEITTEEQASQNLPPWKRNT